MNFRFFYVGLLLCGVVARAAPPRDAERDRLHSEVEELRMVVRTLRAENEKLASRNERLMEDIRLLGRQIQAMKPSPSPAASGAAEPSAERPRPAGLPIVYVNAPMHIMIVEGSTDGLKVGDAGRVVRGDGGVVGMVKISDVKPMQAVLDLDPATLAEGGLYPRIGDRVLLP